MWTVGYSQKKRLGFQEKRMNLGEGLKFVKTILLAVFVLNKCCNALKIKDKWPTTDFPCDVFSD